MRRALSVIGFVFAGLFLDGLLMMTSFTGDAFPPAAGYGVAVVMGALIAAPLLFAVALAPAGTRRLGAGHTIVWTCVLTAAGLISMSAIWSSPEYLAIADSMQSGVPRPQLDLGRFFSFTLPLLGFGGWLIASHHLGKRNPTTG